MIDDATEFDRRALLGALAGLGGSTLAGCAALQPDPDADTTEVEADTARELAERFAPTLYFDEYEEWYPTDPR